MSDTYSTDDNAKQQMAAIRQAIFDYLEEHDKACEIENCHEPESVIAFLAHAVGLRHNKLDTLRDIMLIYEQDCPDCSHLRN